MAQTAMAPAPLELVRQLASAGQQRVEASYPPAVWLAALHALAERERQRAPLHRRQSWLAAIIGAVTSRLGSRGAPRQGETPPPSRRPALPLYLPARLGAVVAPLLAVLREDMAPDAPVTLQLDLRGGTLDQKRVSRQELPRSSSRSAPQITESLYEDAWLAGTAELADGSRLELAVVDQIRKYDIKRRNRRGKLKTKAKYKVKACVDVRLAFPDAYAPLAAGERRDGPGRLAVLPGERRTKVKLRRTFERHHPEAPLAVRSLLDLIATAYSQVAPARAGRG